MTNSISNDRNDFRKCVVKMPDYCAAPTFPVNDKGLEQIDAIVDFIRRRFPQLTPEQCLKAFDLCAARELTHGSETVICDTYGRPLTIGIVGRVLAAFQSRLKMSVNTETTQQFEPVEKPSAEWHFERMLDEVKNTGQLSTFHPFKIIVKHMAESGMISFKPTVDKYKSNAVRSLAETMNQSTERAAVLKWLIEQNIVNNNQKQ